MGAHPSFSATQTQTNSAAGEGTLIPSVSQFHSSIDKQVAVSFPHLFVYYHTKKYSRHLPLIPIGKRCSFVFLFVGILAPPSPQTKNENLCTIICRSISGLYLGQLEGRWCLWFLPADGFLASWIWVPLAPDSTLHPVTLAWLQLKSVSCWVK